jgi:hypothetical protein
VGDLLEAGTADAQTYIENYASPLFQGLGSSLNGGWYNTGKPHVLGGFDVTITSTFAFTPTKKEAWTFNNSDFTNIVLVNGESAQVPTLMSPNTDPDFLPELRLINDEDEELVRLSALTGLGLDETNIPLIKSNAVATPMLELGIGLIKRTELKLRWIPNINVAGAASFNLFGIGFLHEMTSEERRLKAFPLDFSLFASYSRLHVDAVIDEASNQMMDFSMQGTTIQFIGSKKFSIFDFYTGFGLSGNLTQFNLLGTFDVGEDNQLIDPISIRTFTVSPRYNLGARVLYANVSFHAEYVIQQFQMLTFGFGISIK